MQSGDERSASTSDTARPNETEAARPQRSTTRRLLEAVMILMVLFLLGGNVLLYAAPELSGEVISWLPEEIQALAGVTPVATSGRGGCCAVQASAFGAGASCGKPCCPEAAMAQAGNCQQAGTCQRKGGDCTERDSTDVALLEQVELDEIPLDQIEIRDRMEND